MTKTMRERLMEAVKGEGYPDYRDNQSEIEKWRIDLIDAVLDELRAESGPILAAGHAAICDGRVSTGQVADAFNAMIDAVRAGK